MKVGTLIKYKYSTTDNFGVVVDVGEDFGTKSPIYTIEWIVVHPFIKHLKYLKPDSLVEVS